MTELELLLDLHRGTARQGPGSEADTLQAVKLMDLLSDQSLQIADLGCGSGGPTLTLARHLNAQLTAVDLFPEFLEELKRKAAASGLTDQITSLKASMDDLPFAREQMDVIWSEGAIYNIGFESGIQQWREYLKPSGYLAVSEISWITSSRPKEIETFWQQEYPEIDTAANKIRLLETNGYSLRGYFILKPESWLQNYYEPLEASFPAFLARHSSSEMAQQVVQAHQAEIDLYRRYQKYYSYGFYVARKDE